MPAPPTSPTGRGTRCGRSAADLNMPVHFHIGSSNTAMDFFGNYFWPSQDEYVKPAIGGGMLFLNSARVVINTIFSGVFDRYPDLTMVAVESGIGWIPFILETMDYELAENAPDHFKALKRKPSEYFAHNWYATFWFEENQGAAPEPDGPGRRRPDPVRDRLPAPDVPLPVAGRERRRQDERSAPRDAGRGSWATTPASSTDSKNHKPCLLLRSAIWRSLTRSWDRVGRGSSRLAGASVRTTVACANWGGP